MEETYSVRPRQPIPQISPSSLAIDSTTVVKNQKLNWPSSNSPILSSLAQHVTDRIVDDVAAADMGKLQVYLVSRI